MLLLLWRGVSENSVLAPNVKRIVKVSGTYLLLLSLKFIKIVLENNGNLQFGVQRQNYS